MAYQNYRHKYLKRDVFFTEKSTDFMREVRYLDIFTYNKRMAEALLGRFSLKGRVEDFRVEKAESIGNIESGGSMGSMESGGSRQAKLYGFHRRRVPQLAAFCKALDRFIIENNAFEGIDPQSILSFCGGYEIWDARNTSLIASSHSDLDMMLSEELNKTEPRD